ncbi:MAG: DNA gyrase C-terminal beta-propeller domain-containing protein, partial [Bacilli bacterium]
TMIEKIADLVKNKAVEGITDLRDESNREGFRVVIELRKDVIPEVILNQLFKYSPLQVSFGINLLALVNGEPKVLSVKEILLHYLNHQLDITRRKVRYELDKAVEREHLLRGLSIAIFHIDEVIDIIKTSANGEEADQRLQALLQLSERQSKAVLDMKLQRLTGMEQEKIELEITELQKSIEEMRTTLEDPQKLLSVIERDLLDVKNRFGDARRTEFSNDSSMIEDEELIPEEQVIVTLTTNGYIKRVNCDTYRAQNRGGKGIKGITTNDNDAVEKLLITSTHTDLLFFTNWGKVYRLRGHQVPEYSRQGKGLPVVNLLSLDEGETVQAIISVDAYDEDHQLMFVTTSGVVKRVSMSQFENIRQNGKIAVTLREGDRLLNVKKTTGEEEILIASTYGKVVRFASTDVRVMGRTAAGVTGIDLGDATAVGVSTSDEGEYILAITAKGYGKMSPREDYRFTKRGGKGVITVNATEKTGPLVAMRAVNGDEDLLVTTTKGTLIRISLNQVKVAGRNTQGVRIIRMDDDQEVASTAVTEPEPEELLEETSETAVESNHETTKE